MRRAGRIRRGDLVVVDSPEAGRLVVKRVVGLPGELVEIVEGTVRIDGQRLPEPYASPSVFSGVYRVPEGRYVLLGDNRDASSDSRTWLQPYVDRRAIRGRLVMPGRSRREVRARVARHLHGHRIP